jgi:hypothetical protein
MCGSRSFESASVRGFRQKIRVRIHNRFQDPLSVRVRNVVVATANDGCPATFMGYFIRYPCSPAPIKYSQSTVGPTQLFLIFMHFTSSSFSLNLLLSSSLTLKVNSNLQCPIIYYKNFIPQDPRQSAFATFYAHRIRCQSADPKNSVVLRPQAVASAVRTSLACAIYAVQRTSAAAHHHTGR